MKWKCVEVNMKLEVKYLCEVSSLSKSEIGRQNGLTSSTFLTVTECSQLFCMSEIQLFQSWNLELDPDIA